MRMINTTARAINRLKQSNDFKVFMDIFNDELDIQQRLLASSRDEVIFKRAQGVTLFLGELIDSVEASEQIAKL